MSAETASSSQVGDAPPASLAQNPRWALPLIQRMHFYIGLMVAPFILIAAFTGALYVISPQIENILYQDQLRTTSVGASLALEAQIASARDRVGDDAQLAAVRPAPEPGTTTRVMFADSSLGEFQHRAVFIDPITARVVGDVPVYGASGALPLRAWIDQLHRSLHLGDFGRLYSELAASWLWIVALMGLALWSMRSKERKKIPGSGTAAASASQSEARPRRRLSRWHSRTGLFLLLALLFFSATGLTWSQWAGGNISVIRSNLNWGTPSVNTALASAPQTADHGHHHGDSQGMMSQTGPADPALFDAVLSVARASGIDAGMVEIKPAANPDRAWTVTEIDRRWPTQVDARAIDPHALSTRTP